ncbi:MAG TPA: Glu/Leu/Phe/Val dehydrogenase dimerization domain-containing protein [Anaerolineales bacterium]|nr:Glu/Leu/Phe/Val dehydrogenase dimerization domain-containing protein [Anaerolineales bacterium]
MIPGRMELFLRERLPERTWRNRLIRDQGKCYLEFNPLDVDRLARLGIEVDNLGPHLVVCMWDEDSPIEIGGYLVVDNLAMGRPSMGGIRMLPELTPAAVHNLARGMTLKNAAANLPYGGGKSGIISSAGISQKGHEEVIRGFARLLYRYHSVYLPGPDVGTNDADMKTVAIENGLDNALSKPVDMGGNRIDQLGAAAGGVIIALEALLEEMPRLRAHPQFSNLKPPHPTQLTVLIQGFGAVGAHAARILKEHLPGSRVVGISDALGYLYNEEGLPVEQLFQSWQNRGVVTVAYYQEHLMAPEKRWLATKFSTAPDDLLRESAFCLIPAAPIANYLDLEKSTRPCITVEKMGAWQVIIEGANTYSPEHTRKAARARMEAFVYRQHGVLIATDYLVNSGGVIFAAQEHLIKTPEELRIPQQLLGNRDMVDKWLYDHSQELADLAERRRLAAEVYRDGVIRRNMHELVDLLVADADMLPCEAAEHISIRRIASSEADRTAADIMLPIPAITASNSVRAAATLLIESSSPILAVLSLQNELVGVVTGWDITRATATGLPDSQPIEDIMTRTVISARPTDSVLDIIRKLEHHEISAMPVVEEGQVKGLISSDLLARRTLLKLLQSKNP